MNEFELKVREIKDLQENQAQARSIEGQRFKLELIERNEAIHREKIRTHQTRLEELNKFADEIELDKRIEAIKEVYPEWDWDREIPSTKTNYAIYTIGYKDEAVIPYRGTQALVEPKYYNLPVRQTWFIAKAFIAEKRGNQIVLQLNSDIYSLQNLDTETLDEKFFEAIRTPFSFSVYAFVKPDYYSRYMNNVFT